MGLGHLPEAVIVELLNRRFDATDVRLDDLTEQFRAMNGRTRANESAIAEFRPRLGTLEREMDDVRKPSTGENRGVKAWDVGLVAATITLILGFLKLIGKL